MEELTKCPVCESDLLSTVYTIQDYFLTRETFRITQCKSCEFLFTNPRPEAVHLSRYYQTEEYLSHATAKKTTLSHIYTFLRNIAIKNKYALISKYKKTGKILDIGCGTGELLKYFENQGWEAIGIEPAENPRNYAVSKHRLRVHDENYLNKIEVGSFDIITMWHVLEHVSELNERISQVKKLLKDDGTIIIALPNFKSWDANHYKNFWAAWDVPRHLYHFSKSSFTKLATKHNLKIQAIQPMKFDSYYVSLLSEKYKTGNSNYLRAISFGFYSNLMARKDHGNYSSLIFVLKKQSDDFKAI